MSQSPCEQISSHGGRLLPGCDQAGEASDPRHPGSQAQEGTLMRLAMCPSGLPACGLRDLCTLPAISQLSPSKHTM